MSTSPSSRPRTGGNSSSLGHPRGHTSVEERGDQILQTAARLFSQRGYSATRLDDIASELGVTRAALYYYFTRGKIEILELVCAGGMDGAEEVLANAERIEQPLAAVREFMTRYAVHITSGEARVFFRETSELEPEFRRALLRRARSLTRGVVRLLERGVEDGMFRSDLDPEVAANGLLGTLNWMSQWHASDQRMGPVDVIGEQFADLFLRGAAVRSAADDPGLSGR